MNGVPDTGLFPLADNGWTLIYFYYTKNRPADAGFPFKHPIPLKYLLINLFGEMPNAVS